MKPTCTVIFGAPGIGKSTLARELTKELEPKSSSQPVGHICWWSSWALTPRVVELGVLRDKFSGTDGLAMNAQSRVCAWLEYVPYPSILCEGDRLANDAFLNHVQRCGYALQLVRLTAPDALVAQRRVERGSKQNAAWVNGRITKVANLAKRWPHKVLDATGTASEMAAELRELTEAWR